MLSLVGIWSSALESNRAGYRLKIVLNLVPVCTGGGQQQAHHLVSWLAAQDEDIRKQWVVLVGEGTVLHHALVNTKGIAWRALGRGYLNRVWFEIFHARRLVREIKPDVVLHFTTAWKRVAVPQVVRSVYSNLYFPEVPFWPRSPLHRFFKRKIVDFFRLRGTLRADGLIFENKAMQRRAVDMFGYPEERTRYVAPSRMEKHFEKRGATCSIFGARGGFRVLYLSSWHPNKNMQLLPRVAQELQRRGIDAYFVLSLDAADPVVRANVVDPAKELGVSEFFEFIGVVHPNDVGPVVRSADSLILLSQLECYSANVTEAWSFAKPLIISQLEWASVECGDGAVYVDRDNPSDIAEAIRKVMTEPLFRAQITQNGTRRLALLNTHESRFRQQIEFLELISELGKKD
ncbi:MAG: glycosyltransferase [Proteobacteria bacterium]|nr:MAG: glycosyltransferase [Pseudomonadota bacterium]